MLAFPNVKAIFGSPDYYLLVVYAQIHAMDYLVCLEGYWNLTFLNQGYFIRVINVELYCEVLS